MGYYSTLEFNIEKKTQRSMFRKQRTLKNFSLIKKTIKFMGFLMLDYQ